MSGFALVQLEHAMQRALAGVADHLPDDGRYRLTLLARYTRDDLPDADCYLGDDDLTLAAGALQRAAGSAEHMTNESANGQSDDPGRWRDATTDRPPTEPAHTLRLPTPGAIAALRSRIVLYAPTGGVLTLARWTVTDEPVPIAVWWPEHGENPIECQPGDVWAGVVAQPGDQP